MEDIEEVRKTNNWELYQQSVNYMSTLDLYEDSDRNYRMYNGNQWQGVKVENVEPVQLNFIQTIVDYKISVINENAWGIVYSNENFEDKAFKKTADDLCSLLNLRATKIWKRNKMDSLVRQVSLDSAVNDEGVLYSYYDVKDKEVKDEILDKVDIYYGDETNSDIQSQPYILIRKRMTVMSAREYALSHGVSEEKIKFIIGDSDNIHSIGENKQTEKDETCTIIIKLWKEDGKVHYSESTEYVDLIEDTNSGLTRYQIAHFPWTEKKGSARGEGVVRNLIPNQLEVNKILMRRAVVTKNTAYSQKVVKIDNIANPDAINRVGSVIKVRGQADSVSDVFANTTPAQMSSDVEQLQSDLIDLSRNLQNAGDISTGSINPESASGKAILAVQNASHQTLNSQVQALKDFVENVALNWLDLICVYSDNLVLQRKVDNYINNKESTYINVKIPNSSLRKLKASVTIDVTPLSSFDQYAQELALENLLQAGWFAPDKVDQLQLYAESLPERSAMPKQKILDICKKIKEQQMYIQQLQAVTKYAMNQANQYITNQDQSVTENLAGVSDNTDAILQDADNQAYQDALREYQQEQASVSQ